MSKAAGTQSISIIIVNWNTGNLLAKCIESLRSLPEQAALNQVIIIDNASSDDSLERAEIAAQEDKRFSFVRSGENLGFARANNVAIKRLGESTTDHVLLLNPDTEVTPGALAALLESLQKNLKVGVVGPKLVNPNGSLQPSVRQLPSFSVLAGLFLKLHRLLPNDGVWQRYFARAFDYENAQVVEQVMGACLLIRREALNEIGLLDERFWVWFEEVDFCKRVADAGWQVFYTPLGKVLHHGGASFHQLIGLTRSWPFIRSALHYTNKHLGTMAWLGLAVLVPLAVLLALPASFLHAAQKNVPQA